ncbi:MAG TPA: DUF6152 family protein [Gammaproteobacteria bacterium]|nr:DUF6152 family protein [Gammaproteobacteria bacterium]
MKTISRLSKKAGRDITFSALLAAAGVLGFAANASAHHSFAPFQMESEKTIQGDVVDFQWTNPHTWAWLNIKNEDGSVTRWGLEGMSPNYLGRRGWTRHTLKPGDHITAIIHPMKNGEPGGELMRVILADGTKMIMFGK